MMGVAMKVFHTQPSEFTNITMIKNLYSQAVKFIPKEEA